MEKIKFRTEHEMGLHFCDWLLRCFRGKYKFRIFAEVPRTAWNNHADLVLINYRDKQCLMVEIKMSDYKKLKRQVDKAPYTTRVRTIGVINREVGRVGVGIHVPIYKYGLGLGTRLLDFLSDGVWSSVFDSNLGKLYYYAFYFDESNYSGVGLPKREYVLYLLFQKAIESIFRIEGKVISFDIIQGLLPIYSVQVAKKYYNRVVNAGWKN